MSRLLSLSLTCLSIFLGMFFFFHGLMKVSPVLHKDVHMNLRKCFTRYVKVLPFISQLGLKIQARQYRLTIGVIEMIFGLLLALVPGRLKQWANLVLLTITWGAIYTHVMVGDDAHVMCPAFIFSGLLVVRYILHRSYARRIQFDSIEHKPTPPSPGMEADDEASSARENISVSKKGKDASGGENKKRKKKKVKEQ